MNGLSKARMGASEGGGGSRLMIGFEKGGSCVIYGSTFSETGFIAKRSTSAASGSTTLTNGGSGSGATKVVGSINKEEAEAVPEEGASSHTFASSSSMVSQQVYGEGRILGFGDAGRRSN